MPTLKTRYLLDLIQTLSKSEKRHFKLYTTQSKSKEKLYIQLFDLLDKSGVYDEKNILLKIPNIKRAQLSNLKAHLYKQLLRALRDYHKTSYSEIKAREMFDFAKVLYAKGQYQASIAMLQKVKSIALKTQKSPLLYLAISFEKQIESQHVTGSMAKRAAELSSHSAEIVSKLEVADRLSNLALKMYGLYLRRGYAKRAKDVSYLNKFFLAELPSSQAEHLDFYPRLHYYQSHVWYYQMLQNFQQYHAYAKLWVELFDEFPEMKVPETVTYIKGFHNVLNSLFGLGKLGAFEVALNDLAAFKNANEATLSLNEQSQLNLFIYTHQLNLIFLNTNYKSGLDILPELEQMLLSSKYPWDINRKLTFYYKIACVYFGAGRLGESIRYLNLITNAYYPKFKEDIQCFARILNLIAHYDLGNENLVSYQVRSVYRFLLKMKEMQQVQREIFNFIRRTPKMERRVIKSEFQELKQTLLVLRKDKLERRPFLYLDILSWLDSKILNISMVDAIRQRRKIQVE